MKDYDMKKIIYEVKQEERRSKAISRMINHLLPDTYKELRECIRINNLFDTDYY